MSIKQVTWTQKNSHEYCVRSSTCKWYLHLNKRTSKMKSKIFSIQVFTNMTGKLFFYSKWGRRTSPTLLFSALCFNASMVLLITSIWNICLFHIIARLHPPFKSILPALTRSFFGKYLLGRKFARNPLKTSVKEQQQKFTMHYLLSFA